MTYEGRMQVCCSGLTGFALYANIEVETGEACPIAGFASDQATTEERLGLSPQADQSQFRSLLLNRVGQNSGHRHLSSVGPHQLPAIHETIIVVRIACEIALETISSMPARYSIRFYIIHGFDSMTTFI